MLERADYWAEEDHPRAPAGSSGGGQFASGDKSKAAKKSTPAKKAPRKARRDPNILAYDPDSNTGTGYGSREGDPRVKRLQAYLTRLGLTDADGNKLKLDGKLGPKTTAAVKAAQRKLGVKADGKVTPALLRQLASMKSLKSPNRSADLDLCLRTFDFETRAKGDGRTLEGYAAVYNSPARIRDLQGDFDEVILPGAFTRSLSRRMPVMQWEHGKDPRVGSVPIAAIEEINPEDRKGLYVRARLMDDPLVEPIRKAIAAGTVKGMSFRFEVPTDPKGDRWTRRSDDVDLREIRDADTHEIGPVVFPAYDTTSVSVRSILASFDPDERRSLVRELAAEVRLAADLSTLDDPDVEDLDEEIEDDETPDLTVEPGARSAGGGDFDPQPGSGEASPISPEELELRHRALRAIYPGVFHG